MKRVLCVWLLLFALLLSGCGERKSEEPAPAPVPQTVDEQSADPIVREPEADSRPTVVRVISARPTGMDADCYAEVYETLYTFEAGKLTPLLAEAQPDHESGKGEYLIALRGDLCDSAGQPFGASEAAASYAAYGKGQTDKLLLTAESTEKGKLRLCFSRELTPEEEERWLTAAPVYSDRGYGTGPYKIERKSEDELVLVPNETYWGKAGKQNAQSIRYLLIEDAVETVIALETDRADMADGLPYEDAEDFLPGGSYSDLFTTVECYSTVGRYLLPNVGKGSALESEELRLALFSAIDCTALAEKIGGRVCTALGNPDCAELTEGFQSYQTQTSEERTSKSVTLTLLCPANGAGKRCAEALTEQLEGKGYGLILRPLSAEEYLTALDSGEGWDLALAETSASRSAVRQWAELWKYTDKAQSLRGAQTDATLINLLQTVCAGTEGDSVHRLQERVFNHALAMALPQMNEPLVLPLWVKKAALNGNGAILPGSCEYEG